MPDIASVAVDEPVAVQVSLATVALYLKAATRPPPPVATQLPSAGNDTTDWVHCPSPKK